MEKGIKLTPLGAGKEVGRSCILLSVGGKNIMFDCGLHMGYNDKRKYPDFDYISKSGDFDSYLDCIIISHFHLDHCGALPYFTEKCGYSGPIYMTYPTRSICPLLLEDMRKIMSEKPNEELNFTSQDIRNCMQKVISVSLNETVVVNSKRQNILDNYGNDYPIQIKAYYAGHVLGAAMFHVQVGPHSVVYTGDFNMTPDRHLGAAWIDKCYPDVLITETTYASTIRDSKRGRERDFLKKVHDCVLMGGKVLIPVFALGRAQELCILIESYWERMKLSIPLYFSAGLTERANDYYKLHINWTNEKIKNTFLERNMFEFAHIKPWESHLVDSPGPMVLFASPGMLHAGTSLEVFKKWCQDPLNMIILPGYCVSGTVGAKVLAGQKSIQLDRTKEIPINLQVENLSFSAHADAKGIMDLIQMAHPRAVMLVHGEKSKMNTLKQRIQKELGIPTYDPANGESVLITESSKRTIFVSSELIENAYIEFQKLHQVEDQVKKISPITCIQVKGYTTKEPLEDDAPKLPGVKCNEYLECIKHYDHLDKTDSFTKVYNPFSFLSHHAECNNIPREAMKTVVSSLEAEFDGIFHVSIDELNISFKDEVCLVFSQNDFSIDIQWKTYCWPLAVKVMTIVNATLL